MDLHRLRLVEFDKLVSEKQGEKKNIADLIEHKEEDRNTSCSDGKNNETTELVSDKKWPGDNSSSSETSTKSSFDKLHSKSESFRIPSKSKLQKRNVKNISSSVEIAEPFEGSVRSIKRKRSLTLFKRKHNIIDKKEGDLKKRRAKKQDQNKVYVLNRKDKNEDKKKNKDQYEVGLKKRKEKNEEVHFLFQNDTPSFLRYSKRRTKNGRTRKKVDPQPPIDIFGFQSNNRFVDPYLYQMSYKKYLNTDKLPFKKFRNGFRRKLKPSQLDKDNFCKHHGMRVLNSGGKSTGVETRNSQSIYYTLSNYSQLRKIRHGRDTSISFYEDVGEEDPIAKDQNVAVSPSSLLPITTSRCDTGAGPSNVELTYPSQAKPSRHLHPLDKASPSPLAQQKSPSQQKSYPQHSTPSPSTPSATSTTPSNMTNEPVKSKSILDWCKKKRTYAKKLCSFIISQRKTAIAHFFQKVTAFHLKARSESTGKNCIKYAFFGLLIVVWSPCLLAVILVWVIMCPVRTTSILAPEKTHHRSFPITTSFMKRVRKKCSGSVYQRMCFDNYSWQKKRSFWSSATSWNARAAGTIINSFKAMISMLKLKNKTQKRAESLFLPSTHPNPRRKYTLFYSDNRGWIMKPRRSHTRSCASTRVLQNMRCELKPAFRRKSNYNQSAKSGSFYQCPEHGLRYFNINAKLKQSPAGDAVAACACNDVVRSSSGEVITPPDLNIRNNMRGSAINMPVTAYLFNNQVNISPIFCYPTSSIAPEFTKYQAVINNPKNFNSVKITDISPNDFAKYRLSQRKNRTLPRQVVLDCPYGAKHPVIKNRDSSRTHKFTLAGKDLKMKTKYTSITRGQPIENELTKIKSNNTLHTYRTKFSPSHKSTTECKIALSSKTPKEILTCGYDNRLCCRRHHKSCLTDISQTVLTNQAGTSTHKIYLTDKTQMTSKRVIDLYCPCESSDESVPKESFSKQISKTDKILNHDKVTVRKDIKKNTKPLPKQDLKKHSASRNKTFQSSAKKVPSIKTVPLKKAMSTTKFQSQQKRKEGSKYKGNFECACKGTKTMIKDNVQPKPTYVKPENQTRSTLPKHPLKQQETECPCVDPPNKTEETVKPKKQKKQATQCSCTNLPTTTKKTVQSKQTTSANKTKDCGCGTEKLKTLPKHPLTQPASECRCSASECRCSASECHCSASENQKLSDKKTVKCNCRTQYKKKVALPKQAKDKPNMGKVLVKKKQSVSFKKPLNCYCRTEKKTMESLPEKGKAEVSKYQASQCACKDAPATIKDKVQAEKASLKPEHPSTQKASECACKFSPSKLVKTTNKTITCGCNTKKQTKPTQTVQANAKKEEESKYQPSQCPCKDTPTKMKDTIQLTQSLPAKQTIECGCGTDSKYQASQDVPSKTTKTVQPKQTTSANEMIDCGCGPERLKTLPRHPLIQPASECPCEGPPCKPEKTTKKMTTCGCGTEEQTQTTLPEQKRKEGSKFQPAQCTCKGTILIKDTVQPQQSLPAKQTKECGCGTDSKYQASQDVPTKTTIKEPKQTTSVKKTLDCGCGTEKQTKTTHPEQGRQEGSKYKPPHCVCIDAPTKMDTVQPKQTLPAKQTLECGCGTDNKYQASQDVPTKTTKTVQPKQTTSAKETKDCGCGTETLKISILPRDPLTQPVSECPCEGPPCKPEKTNKLQKTVPAKKRATCGTHLNKNTSAQGHLSREKIHRSTSKIVPSISKDKIILHKQTVFYHYKKAALERKSKEINFLNVSTPNSSTSEVQKVTQKKNTPRIYWDSLRKISQHNKINKKSNCHCGAKNKTRDTLSEHLLTLQVPQCFCDKPLCKARQRVQMKKPIRTTKHPSKQQMLCACDNPLCQAKEKVAPKLMLPVKKSLACGYDVENQTQMTLPEQGKKEESQDQESQYDCKKVPITTMETVQPKQTGPPKETIKSDTFQQRKTTSAKKMVDYECRTEKEIRATLPEHHLQRQASPCFCDNPLCHAKEKSIQTLSANKSIACGCDVERQTQATLSEQAMKEGPKNQALQYKEILSTTKKTAQPKQKLSANKTIEYECGTEEQTRATEDGGYHIPQDHI